jgi:hypothetical protein
MLQALTGNPRSAGRSQRKSKRNDPGAKSALDGKLLPRSYTDARDQLLLRTAARYVWPGPALVTSSCRCLRLQPVQNRTDPNPHLAGSSNVVVMLTRSFTVATTTIRTNSTLRTGYTAVTRKLLTLVRSGNCPRFDSTAL